MDRKIKNKKICVVVITMSFIFQIIGAGQLLVYAEYSAQAEEVLFSEVLLTADAGVLPEDVVLNVYKIESQAEKDKIEEAIVRKLDSQTAQLVETISFDITLYDRKGNEIQPDRSKGRLKVSFKNVNTKQTENGEQSILVYHVQDDYSDVEKINCEVENKMVEFEASHFSTYTLTMLTADIGSEVIAGMMEIICIRQIAMEKRAIIENEVFSGCTKLDELDLSKVTTISEFAFWGCSSLTKVDLSKVTAIENYAFLNCVSLISIDLSQVTTIKDNAFRGCTALEKVIFKDTKLTTVGVHAFFETKSPLIIQVPVGAEAYFKALFNAIAGMDYQIVTQEDTGTSENIHKGSHKTSDTVSVIQLSQQKEAGGTLPIEKIPQEGNDNSVVPRNHPVSKRTNETKIISDDTQSIKQTEQEEDKEDKEALEDNRDTIEQKASEQNVSNTIQTKENAAVKEGAGWLQGISVAVLLSSGILLSCRVRKMRKNMK